MSEPSGDPAFALVAARFAALEEALAAVPAEPDRRIARDAVRDALDRRSAPDFGTEIVAGSFLVLRLLNRSVDFEVLLLRQRDVGTRHALKAPLPERASDPLLRRLLQSEAVHQARIRHPACLPLGALLRLTDGRPALLTDHVEAPTLADVLRHRSLDAAETIALGTRLALALDAVHGAGLVHADVSPGNVFLPGAKAGAAILFDFGLSRPVGAPGGEDLRRALTPAFAAPEMRDASGASSPACDLFSLGRLLSTACAGPPARLAALLTRLQSETPERRGDSARHVADELARCGIEATS